MIAPNENTAATPKGNDGVVIANAGRGAVNHYLSDSEYLARLEALACRIEGHLAANEPLVCPDSEALLDRIRAHDGDPLVCPCHDDPFGNGPCPECRVEIDAMLVRRGLKPSAGYFVDSCDGEPRDVEDDQC